MLSDFPQIPVPLPELAILKRLGFNRTLTAIPPEQAEKFRSWMNTAFTACALCGRTRIMNIHARGNDFVELEDGTRWISIRLAKALAPFARVAIFAATAGAKIGQLTCDLLAANNGAAALVYDATASESTDAAAEWLDKFLTRQSRIDYQNNFRFSPGYFDWPLAAQSDIMRLLSLQELNITLTPHFQLSPEKTVTAVKGV